MRPFATLRAVSCAGIVLLSAATALAATQGAASNAPARVEMTDDGPVLLTPAGATLYTFAPDDTTPGKLQCTNIPKLTYRDPMGELGEVYVVRPDAHKACVQKWPPLMADDKAQPNGDFSLIARTEGGKQWMYRGHPLYTSVKDKQPGDRNGAAMQGGGGNNRGWRLAMAPLELPASLKVMRVDAGLILTTENARPVYTPKGRKPAICQGCEELFTPIAAPDMAMVGGDWTTVDAGAGRKQYAFKGKPLYAAPESLKDYDIEETGAWEVVVYRKGPGRPREVETRHALIGDVYADKAGRTLYAFTCRSPTGDGVTCDDPGDAAGYWVALCGDSASCAKKWKPYLAAPGARSVGEWSVVDVAYPVFTDPRGFTYPPEAPRVKAWAYRGKPVYTYYEDTKPGDVWGHRIQWVLFSSFMAVQVPGTSEDR